MEDFPLQNQPIVCVPDSGTARQIQVFQPTNRERPYTVSNATGLKEIHQRSSENDAFKVDSLERIFGGHPPMFAADRLESI